MTGCGYKLVVSISARRNWRVGISVARYSKLCFSRLRAQALRIGAQIWPLRWIIPASNTNCSFIISFRRRYLKTHFTDREADDIANLAFIGGGTNRRISDKPPSDYIPALVAKGGSGPLISQGIPLDKQFLSVGAYKEFLTERRKNVARMLNTFLGTDDVADQRRRRSSKAAAVPSSCKHACE